MKKTLLILLLSWGFAGGLWTAAAGNPRAVFQGNPHDKFGSNSLAYSFFPLVNNGFGIEYDRLLTPATGRHWLKIAPAYYTTLSYATLRKTDVEHLRGFSVPKKENELYFINLSDVLYFESVDNRIYLYTEKDVLEIKQRLYELEFLLSDKDFIRISKSQIVNIQKITSLKPELNRTILATMCNGEQLSISRKYVKALRNLLSV